MGGNQFAPGGAEARGRILARPPRMRRDKIGKRRRRNYISYGFFTFTIRSVPEYSEFYEKRWARWLPSGEMGALGRKFTRNSGALTTEKNAPY